MKHLAMFILILLLCLGCAGAASANSWGLTGRVLDRVMETRDWDEYNGIGQLESDCMSIAMLESRYHIVLLASFRDENGVWMDYPPCTACLYQPKDNRANPQLRQLDTSSFMIVYPDNGERYAFQMQMEQWGAGAATLTITLSGIQLGSKLNASYDPNTELWTVNEALTQPTSMQLTWIDHINLSDFSISLAPRSTKAFCQMRDMSRVLTSYLTGCDDRGTARKEPVYTAPSAHASRAGDGKASVSLSAGVRTYGQLGDFDLVEYAISQRSGRIGFIRHGLLEMEQVLLDTSGILTPIPVITRATYLTDDPHISQRHMVELPEGTKLTLLANITPCYACAVYIAPNGEEIWGFVPLQDVVVPEIKTCSADASNG